MLILHKDLEHGRRGVIMATQAEQRRERKLVLSRVRKAERALDSALEVLEREIRRQQRKSTLLDSDDSARISDKAKALAPLVTNMERTLTDYLKMTSL